MGTRYELELFESAHDHADVIAPTITRPANFRRKSHVLSTVVLAVLIPGLFATVALPAYGANPSAPVGSSATGRVDAAGSTSSQTAYVSASAEPSALHRDTVEYVKPKPKPKPKAVVQVLFTGRVQSYGNVDITGIAAIAAKYIGVPYVFGGESPRGFDCSGLVEYVYAQVGISLPHSSMAQGQLGTRVPLSKARPGDVLVFNGGSHVGIYIGGGHMIDAPYPGRVVSIDKIYTNAYWIVHY